MAGGQRQVAQQPQGDGVAQTFAQALVALVAGAQAVAVQQQRRLTIQLDHAAFSKQGAAGRTAKALAEQEVAIAVHQVDLRAAIAQAAQGAGDGALELVHAVVADPHFEEVAENVQRLGTHGAGVEEMQERPDDVRAFRFEMQVRDEQDAHRITRRRLRPSR
ncbi:hypothetical protein D3C75_989830 [compost metagenome]